MRSRFGILIVLYPAAIPTIAQPAGEEREHEGSNAAVEKIIAPFVTKHCGQCHGHKKKNDDLTLHTYKDEKSILKDRKKWHEVMKMLHSGEMPPEKQPRPDIKDAE